MAIDRPLVVSFVAALAIHGAVLAVFAGAVVSRLVEEASIPVDVDFDVPSEPVVVDSEETEPQHDPVVRRAAPPRPTADVVREEDPELVEDDDGAVLDFFEAEEAELSFTGGVSAGTQTEGDGTGAAPQAVRGAEPDDGETDEVSRARPVSLPARRWSCPWPDAADDLGIHRQTVTLRAVVDERGRARRVTVLSDPGYGFGDAARTCALSARFSPALGDDGTPLLATSPPIRVRFSR